MRIISGRVGLGILMCAALSACGGKRPAGKPSQQAAVPFPSENREVVKDLGLTTQQPAELLQQSVARVLGFVDIYGKNVQVYQDAYSALYDNLARQASAPAGSIPGPIFYHSPVFIPGIPQVVLLGSGELSVKIKNIATTQYVRGRIASKLAQTLKDYKIDANLIDLLPIESASGKLKAFGREYEASVEKDFSIVSVIIPRTDIPPRVRDEILKDADGIIDSESLLQSFSQLPITYTYYVQRYREQDCHFNIDDSYINKMYTTSQCTDPADKSAAANPAAAVDKAFAEAGKPKADGTVAVSFPGAQKSQVQALVAASKSTITACMAGEERSNLQAKASVKCTKPAKSADTKAPEGFDAQIMSFLDNSVKSAMSTQRLNPDDPNSWNNQAVAAAIRLFGSPEQFRSEVTKFNEEIENAVEEGREVNLADQAKVFTDRISEYGELADNTTGSSASASTNAGMGVSMFSGNFGKGNSKSNFDRAVRDVVDKLQETGTTETLKKSQEIFKKYGMDHAINEVGGKLYFYPSINVSVKADVERIRKSAGQYATNELGNIVVEKREISAALNRREDLKIEFTAFCTAPGKTAANPIAFAVYIDQIDWAKDVSPGGFWDLLNAKVKERLVTEQNCRTLVLQAFFSGLAGNEDLVPSGGVRMNMHGGALANKVATPQLKAEAASGVLELMRSNNSSKAFAQSSSIGLESDRAFDEVKLRGQ